jgi:hypothetical protein
VKSRTLMLTPALRERGRLMTEDRGPDSLDASVRELIADLGLYGYRSNGGTERGWPDWVIIGPCGILYRELKTERGTLTPEQRDVGARITKAGGNWSVWRPVHLLSGEIAQELSSLAAAQLELWSA